MVIPCVAMQDFFLVLAVHFKTKKQEDESNALTFLLEIRVTTELFERQIINSNHNSEWSWKRSNFLLHSLSLPKTFLDVLPQTFSLPFIQWKTSKHLASGVLKIQRNLANGLKCRHLPWSLDLIFLCLWHVCAELHWRLLLVLCTLK